MIDMSTWPNRQADVVEDLHLDQRNVRLETPQGVPETDIIHDLFRNERALGLVEAISQVGYFTHELPIVVLRDEEMIVVEGNRRLAALKAIQNPYLAPSEQRARIAKLAAAIPNRDVLREITVKIAPTQDYADQIIAALHTGKQRVPWSPPRQAAFFQAQIDAGKTLSQLLSQYPTIDVKDFVVRSKMLELFRSARYQDPELKDYVSRRRFPVSILARLYEYDKFQELAQIEVNKDKARVSLRGDKQQFNLLARKIISDIKTKRIDTRVLNSTESVTYQDYMRELRDFINEPPRASSKNEGSSRPSGSSPSSGASSGGGGSASDATSHGGTSPNGKRSGSGSGSGQGSQSGSGTDDNDSSSKGKSGSKAPSNSYLVTDGLDATKFPAAIGLILTELSLINISRFPNATFDLLRSFLEKTIKAYAEIQKVEIKNTSNLNGYVQLSHALAWLELHLKNTGQTALIQVVQKIRSGKISDFVPSKKHLDAINHNHLIFATSGEVRECWNTMNPILQLMLKP